MIYIEHYRECMEATAAFLYGRSEEEKEPPEHRPIWTPPPHFSFIGMYLVPHQIQPTVSQIKAAVVKHLGLLALDLTSQRREDARPRQIVMYLAKALTVRSYAEIGSALGGRDHSTVLHGIRQIAALRKSDAAMDATVGKLMKALS